MILTPRFIAVLFVLLILALIGALVLFLFWKKLYHRLSARLAVLILASGLVTLIIYLLFDELTGGNVPSRIMSLLQLTLLLLGGPGVLAILVARFVRRPLRQFKKAISSLEQSNYKTQLQPMGIHEFDQVFTRFNNLTKRLQQEEKLRKDLVSDTSHELKTPLTAMIGQLTAIEEGKHDITKERITALKGQAERLADLVQQLDDYTKARMPSTGQPEAIRLKQFCEELIHHFSLELKKQGIAAKLIITDDHIIHANRNALQQILTNLLQNTLRYSQATELTITATPNELVFSDNGKGVPAKNLPFLFERFYRVDRSRSRESGGLGLGLAIVKELVENQGWAITAQANHPGLSFTLKTRATN